MNTQERRNFPRINIDYVTVEVYSSTSQGHHSSGIEEICPVINLSENGMRFSAEQSFAIGQILRLTFVLPDSIVIIRAAALVVHCSKSNRNTSNIGVQFKNLGIAEQILIRHFINKNLNPK